MKTPEQILETVIGLPAESWDRVDYIAELHRRNDSATFDAAATLLRSTDSDRRSVGVVVLAQLGGHFSVPLETRPFRAATSELLLDLIPGERDPEVLACIAVAFGHLQDPRAIPHLHELAAHNDERVRDGVVHGLMGIDDDLAVQTLITLSADESPYVRDWATFGLAMQIDRDDPTLRNALAARMNDPDEDTRAEALRGLATRGDLRALSHLISELSDLDARDDTTAIDQAVLALAAKTGDDRLCERVRTIQTGALSEDTTDDPWPELEAAVKACGQNADGA